MTAHNTIATTQKRPVLFQILEKFLNVLLWRTCCKQYGLSRSTVHLRTFTVGTFLTGPSTLILGVLVYNSDKSLNTLIEKNFSAIVFICSAFVGIYWALYLAFNSEFVSKYTRLATIHDEHLTKLDRKINRSSPLLAKAGVHELVLHLLQATYLNFAEDCLIYHMETSTSFADTFSKVIAVLGRVKVIDPQLYLDLVYDLKEIPALLASKSIDGTFGINLQSIYDASVAAEIRLHSFWESAAPSADGAPKTAAALSEKPATRNPTGTGADDEYDIKQILAAKAEEEQEKSARDLEAAMHSRPS